MAVCGEAPRRIAHIAADRRPTSDATRWSALTVSVSSCFFSSSSSSSSRSHSLFFFFVLVIDKTKQFNYLINWLLNCLHIMHIMMFFFYFLLFLFYIILFSCYFIFALSHFRSLYFLSRLSSCFIVYVFILFLFVLYKSISYVYYIRSDLKGYFIRAYN